MKQKINKKQRLTYTQVLELVLVIIALVLVIHYLIENKISLEKRVCEKQVSLMGLKNGSTMKFNYWNCTEKSDLGFKTNVERFKP